MQNPKIIKYLFILVFIIASFLRMSLAIVNRDANDNHFKVIRIIANENRIPQKEEFECLQCYHPKLYHYTAAKAINLFFTPPADPLSDLSENRKIVSQMINALAGIATLLVIFKFLKKLDLDPIGELLTFSLVALNPALIGINVQATNDTFVILFSSLAIFFLFLLLKSGSWKHLLCLFFSVFLASLSKGSGILIFLGVLVVFLAKMIASFKNSEVFKRQLIQAFVFSALFLSIVIPFGPYDEYYLSYGTPLIINKPKSKLPHFLERTYEGDKTGVTSIFDSYFTFHFFDLLENPYLNRETEPEKYSLNRMSVWTQLYARDNFIQFEGHPKKWFVKLSNPIYELGKVIFVFALIPLAIFIYGIFIGTRKVICGLRNNGLVYFSAENEWLFVLFFWLFFAFIIKFTLDYRDYTTSKPIYLFPGVLAFAYLFSIGLKETFQKTKKSIFIQYGITAAITILLFLYTADIAHLLKKLS